MGYNFFDLAQETFKAVKKPLTINDLWKKAVELGFSDKVKTSGKTPWNTLGARIYMDIKENPDTDFIQISKRPATFYLRDLWDENKIKEDKPTTVKPSFNERDLHALLTAFVFSNPHFNCYTKTIYHENSKKNKKGYNKWLHPDLVGVYFPFKDYHDKTLKLLETFKENQYKLFSFEIKTEINFSYLREYYFQAVSNSTWAHEGYLVTLKIDKDPLFIDEVRRLNNAFGIGIIKLDSQNIEQSEILFSAKTKEFLDWETIDRLTDENTDFRVFLDDLMEDAKVSKVKSNYDKVLSEKDLMKHVHNKGIDG